MNRTIDLGTNGHGYSATVEITLTPGRVSLVGFTTYRGEEDSGGQIDHYLTELYPDNPHIAELCRMWDRWHLNDMRAGCPHQESRYRRDPAERPTYANDYTGTTGDTLSGPCSECGYRYGTAWLSEELPADVVRFFANWTPNP